jgi:DNA mismatch repair ATPase MutS
MLTTHYLDVCRRLTNHPNIQMKYMEVIEPADENDDFVYTYSMKDGISTVQGGIKVLRQLNYPLEILQTIADI